MLKLQMSLTGVGSEGKVKMFEKPGFCTFDMFLGMVGALAVAFVSNKMKAKSVPQEGLKTSLIDASEAAAAPAKPEVSYRKKVLMVAAPALCDVVAMVMCLVGLLYIPASVWQLMRAFEVVAAEVLAVLVLRKPCVAHRWVGVSLVLGGLALVGAATILGTKAEASEGVHKDLSLVTLGIVLSLASQVVAAMQMTGEEYMASAMELPPLEIVGYEGAWGLLFMLIGVFPLLHVMPGEDNGHFEDLWDTVTMVSNSGTIFCSFLVLTFSCLAYNMAGIFITSALSAVHRVMIEALRTLVVWVWGLFVHYCISRESSYGEAWTSYSYLEVIGFVVLILGQAIYGGLLRVPMLSYPPAADQPRPSPSPIRSLTVYN